MKKRYARDPVALFRLLNKLTPYNEPELMRLELPLHMSFESLKNGKGTEQDLFDLVSALKTAALRAKTVGGSAEEVAVDAVAALRRVWERYKTLGKLGFDGPALQEVSAGIELHAQFVRMSTPHQMIEALKEVKQQPMWA